MASGKKAASRTLKARGARRSRASRASRTRADSAPKKSSRGAAGRAESGDKSGSLRARLYLWFRRNLPWILPRDYKFEYKYFDSTDRRKQDRASRNRIRRRLERMGRVRKGDGKQIHHRDGNPRNNRLSNIVVVDHCEHRRLEGKRCRL